MTLAPRGWWAIALGAALLVHLVATALLLLPALALGRRHPELSGALPQVRWGLIAIGAVAAAIAAFRSWRAGRAAPAFVGLAIVGALLFTGTLYGCARTAHIEPKPVATRVDDGRRVFSHAALDRVLERFVDERGMVDYAGLVARRADLDEYVGQLASASPRSAPGLFPTEADRIAYWINAYNALMLRAVVDHYPIDSVTDIMIAHGVFNRLRFPVGGDSLTLDDIEKGILIREHRDPRLHFALTCASMSCPALDRRAFHPEGLGERLDAEGRDFLRSPEGVRIDEAKNVVRLSSYFKWYRSDFGPDPIAFVRPYLDEPGRRALDALERPAIEYLDYDWRLNDRAASWARR